MWSLPRCFFGGLITGVTLMACTRFPPDHAKDAEEDKRAEVWQRGFFIGLVFSLVVVVFAAGIASLVYEYAEEVIE